MMPMAITAASTRRMRIFFMARSVVTKPAGWSSRLSVFRAALTTRPGSARLTAMAEVDGNRTRRTGVARPTRFEGGGAHQVLGHLQWENLLLIIQALARTTHRTTKRIHSDARGVSL